MDLEDARILLVDDEVAHLETLERLFEKEGHEVVCASGGQEALDRMREESFHLVITDLKMPEIDGMDVLKLAGTLQPETEVILMTAFGTVERAVKGMKEGAYDFVPKPIKRNTILKAARQALERQALVAENRQLKERLADLEADDGRPNVVGQSPLMREAVDRVRQAAPSDATVLITGESGTGKELFAEMIYHQSHRAEDPFITVNCAALPESILESELFGYEKGAFTGANQDKIGRFEAADGGTLFLDEIGEMSTEVQVKLLRVLQEGEFERLGANHSTEVDVRIVAATNRDLEEQMEAGEFREDLYYRLNVIDIKIPPLRHRLEDVPLLAEHFLQTYNAKNDRRVTGFSQEALDQLRGHDWPGNVRELENAIERAVVLDTDDIIDVDDLSDDIQSGSGEDRHITIPLGTSLDEIEERVVHETLKMTQGDKELAAKLLGIAKRTIYRKI